MTLGHIGCEALHRIIHMGIYKDGFEYQPTRDEINDAVRQCHVCAKSKATRAPFPIKEKHSKEVLERVHVDIAGPLPQESLGRSRYIATFTDEASKYISLAFLKHKNRLMEATERFATHAEAKHQRSIKFLRLDNAGENTSPNILEILNKHEIVPEFTAPYSPASNGIAEPVNRTLGDTSRAMLLDFAGDSQNMNIKTLWAEAYAHAAWLRNRIVRKGNCTAPWKIGIQCSSH
jgi:transposase InsO family protein